RALRSPAAETHDPGNIHSCSPVAGPRIFAPAKSGIVPLSLDGPKKRPGALAGPTASTLRIPRAPGDAGTQASTWISRSRSAARGRGRVLLLHLLLECVHAREVLLQHALDHILLVGRERRIQRKPRRPDLLAQRRALVAGAVGHRGYRSEIGLRLRE